MPSKLQTAQPLCVIFVRLGLGREKGYCNIQKIVSKENPVMANEFIKILMRIPQSIRSKIPKKYDLTWMNSRKLKFSSISYKIVAIYKHHPILRVTWEDIHGTLSEVLP